VQRDQAGLTELRRPHDEQLPGGIEVVTVEPHRLTAAQTGHREQPDQGRERGGLQRVGQHPCLLDQHRDLGVGVHVRRDATWLGGQQVGGYGLGLGVEHAQIAGESADHRKALGDPDLADVCRLAGPPQGADDRDRGQAGSVGEGDEVAQQPPGTCQLESHRPAHRQVLLGVLAQRAHQRVSGQGRASVASAATSTLA
jgi:hypothetical protein